MRFLMVTSLIFLIGFCCLTNGQLNDGSASLSNPKLSPSSNGGGGIGSFKIVRLFSNLFTGKSKNNKINNKNDDVPDPLTKEDFESQLAKQSSDKMINDAISDRILEESRSQLAVGSPFIEQPSTDTDVRNDNSLSNHRQGKNMANTPTDSIPLAEALRIVNTSNLSDCVARVICELSCNANAYGNEGRVVFRNLIKLQFDQNIKSDDAKFFRLAAAKGRQIIQGKRNCNECYTIYSSCKSDSKDLIAVSSMFKL